MSPPQCLAPPKALWKLPKNSWLCARLQPPPTLVAPSPLSAFGQACSKTPMPAAHQRTPAHCQGGRREKVLLLPTPQSSQEERGGGSFLFPTPYSPSAPAPGSQGEKAQPTSPQKGSCLVSELQRSPRSKHWEGGGQSSDTGEPAEGCVCVGGGYTALC